MNRLFAFGVCVGLSVFAINCGSDPADGGSGGSGSGSGTPGTTVSKEISAAEGGVIEADGVSISIPPGALAEDTTITVGIGAAAGKPDEGSIASSVYEFGPDGLTFNAPVTVTIEFAGTPPEGEAAKLAWLDGGAWKALEDSAVSGTKATATTTHFSTYAVVWLSGGGQVQGACSALDFSPCGGTLDGDWDIVDACTQIMEDPFKGQCPGASISATMDFTVVASFDGGAYSLTGNATANTLLFVPLSCIGDCSNIEGSVLANGGCQKSEQETVTVNDTGTFTTSGNELVLTESDMTVTKYEYCVTGDTAMLRSIPESEEDTITTLKLVKK